MKPCKACKQQYDKFLCNDLGHCVFEGTYEWPKLINGPAFEPQLVEQSRQIQAQVG